MPRQESVVQTFSKGFVHDTYNKEGYRLGIGVSLSKDELHHFGLRVAKDHLDVGYLRFPFFLPDGVCDLSTPSFLVNHEIISAYTIDDTLFMIVGFDAVRWGQRLFVVAEMDSSGTVSFNIVAKLPLFPMDYFEMVGVRDGGESDNLKYRFYFIPKDTEPMTIVVYKNTLTGTWYSPNVACNNYYLFPDVDPSFLSFYSLTGGNLLTGAYQYSFRYVTEFGTVTPWFPLTRRLIMPSGLLCYYGNAWKDRRLHEVGVNSNKGFRLRLHYIDRRFRYLQIAYVYMKSDNSVDHAAIFKTIDLKKCGIRNVSDWWQTEMFIDHTKMGGELIDHRQFDIYYQAIKSAKTVEMFNNRIFFGNVEYHPRSLHRAVIPDPANDVSVVNAPSCFDSKYTNYKFRKPYVEPRAYGTVIGCPTTSNCVGSLEHIGIPLSTIRRRPAPIINGYSDFRDVQMDFSFSGYKRGDTYRFGVVVFDKKMRPSFVTHLADITFPVMYEQGRDANNRPYSNIIIRTYNPDTCSVSTYTKNVYLYPEVSSALGYYDYRRLPVFENTDFGFGCDANLIEILNKRCLDGTDIPDYWEKYGVSALSLKKAVHPLDYTSGSYTVDMSYAVLSMGLRISNLRIQIYDDTLGNWRTANKNDINGFLIVRAEADPSVLMVAGVTPALEVNHECVDRHGCGSGTFYQGATVEQHPGMFPVMGLQKDQGVSNQYITAPCYSTPNSTHYWRAVLNWREWCSWCQPNQIVNLYKLATQIDEDFCWGDNTNRLCNLMAAWNLVYLWSPDIAIDEALAGKKGSLGGSLLIRLCGVSIGVWGDNSCLSDYIFNEEFDRSVCNNDKHRYHTVSLMPTILSHNTDNEHGGYLVNMDFSKLKVYGRYTTPSDTIPYYNIGYSDRIDWVSSLLPNGPWTYCEGIDGSGMVYANMHWLARGLIDDYRSTVSPCYGEVRGAASNVKFWYDNTSNSFWDCPTYSSLTRGCPVGRILRKRKLIESGGQSAGLMVKLRYTYSMFVTDCIIAGVGNGSVNRYINWFFWDRHHPVHFTGIAFDPLEIQNAPFWHRCLTNEAAIPIVEVWDGRSPDKQYGGLNETSLSNTKYITTGAFYPLINTGEEAFTDYMVVFGGDTYAGLFPFMYLLPHYDTPDGLTYSRVYILPFESRKNFMLTTGNRVTTANISGERTNCSGFFANTGPDHFVQNERVELASVALLDEIVKFYFPSPQLFREAIKFPNRFVYSDKKVYGEFIDRFQSILPGYYYDCAGQYGEITASASFNDRLYIAQRSAVNIVAIDETRVIPDTGGESLVLGVQSGVAYAKPITPGIGVQSWYGLRAGMSGVYGIDNIRKAIFRISNGIDVISGGAISSFLDGVLGENLDLVDEYVSRILKDLQNRELIFVVGTAERQFPVVYDEALGVFTGIDRMVPGWGGNIRGYLLAQIRGVVPVSYDLSNDFSSGYVDYSVCPPANRAETQIRNYDKVFLWRVSDIHWRYGFNEYIGVNNLGPSKPFVDFIVTTNYNYATTFDTIDIALDTFPFVRGLFDANSINFADPTIYIERIEFISEAGYSFIDRTDIKYREGIIRGPVKPVSRNRRHRGKWLLVRIWFTDNIVLPPTDWYEPRTLTFKRLMNKQYPVDCDILGLDIRNTMPRVMSVRVNYRTSMDI